jgi:DNA topoisomerase-1
MTTSLPTNPELAAREAGLRYVDPSSPGISRRRAGKGFTYLDANGERITDDRVRERILSLVIPPAWTDVWMCPSPNGHIQATGLDDRGRKQYIYHPKWREFRDEAKYHQLIDFAEALPKIRAEIDTALRRKGLPRDKVIAAVVSLLEKTLIRVGNASYAKENHSFGLTTLRNRHVDVNGETITFRFRGKSGIEQMVDLKDRRLAGIIRKTQELPGQELVQYLDEDGNPAPITSDDVNQFLKDVTGREFTAKDFRTWGGTVLAAMELAIMPAESPTGTPERDIVSAIDAVAKQLGNTRAVCRSCYVHPEIVEAYLEGQTIAPKVAMTSSESDLPFGDIDLSPIERAVLRLLKKRS